MSATKSNVIEISFLEQFNQFIKTPVVVFNESQVLYVNDCYKKAINQPNLDLSNYDLQNDFKLTHKEQQEISLYANNHQIYHFEVTIKPVVFNGLDAKLAIFFDISDRKKVEEGITQIAHLRELMIRISNLILDSSSLSEFFDFILGTTLQAIETTTLGSILLVDEHNMLKVAASYGYSDEINDFYLPLTDSFLYRQSDGLMNDIMMISNDILKENLVHIPTSLAEDAYLQSSISGPIYFQGKLYGIINVDALEKDAFSEYDLDKVAFISKSIEIAITNRLLYEEKVFLSRHDRITNLHNRHFFDEFSDILLRRAQRYEETFHLVMIDVNDLKYINDYYSHLAGDQVIIHIANTISTHVRDSDIFARFGGDEFVGILFNGTYEALRDKVEALNQWLIKHPLLYDNQHIATSISYGIAQYPKDGNSISQLIKVADDRMYEYKRQFKTK